MADQKRFRVLGDLKVLRPDGASVVIKADRPDADLWAYVPLSDPVVVVIEGVFECQVPRSIFESHTEPWNARGVTA